jgi:3-methyladenine DNA glycosylase AlkD
MARTSAAAPSAAMVLAELRALGSERGRAGMTRFAINTEKALGVSMAAMRPLERKYRRNHALAAGLWASGYHEARILAALIDEPDKVTRRQMDAWAAAFDSWDLCDQACMKVFSRTPFVAEKVANGRRTNGNSCAERHSPRSPATRLAPKALRTRSSFLS